MSHLAPVPGRLSPIFRPIILATPFEDASAEVPAQLLDEDAQRAIMAIAELVMLPARAVIYRQGEPARFVYNIVQGASQTIEVHADGEQRVTAFLFRGDMLGLSAQGAYIATAQSLTPQVVFKIPVDALRAAMAAHPGLDVDLLCKLCHDLRCSQRHTATVAKRQAVARVASFLLWVHGAYGETEEEQDLIVLPMRRHDMADYIGLSPEAVSRALHMLEMEGTVHRDGVHAVRVLNRAQLRRTAGRR